MSERLSRDAPQPPQVRDVSDSPSRRRRPILSDETASEAIVAAVANAEEADPTALPPLDDRVDADYLNKLLDESSEPTAVGLVFTRSEEIDSDVEVSFQYAGYDVTVSENHVLLE
jgi:hypothetical protein